MYELFVSDASDCFTCYTFGIGRIVLLQLSLYNLFAGI